MTHKQMTVLYTTDRYPAGRAAESELVCACWNKDECVWEGKKDRHKQNKANIETLKVVQRLEQGKREQEEEGRC